MKPDSVKPTSLTPVGSCSLTTSFTPSNSWGCKGALKHFL
jgi:hypothetical protein